MVLFRRSRQTVGLDVGSGYIKAAVVDHSAEQPRLMRVASLPLMPDSIVEGEIMDPPLVVETIQTVMQMLGAVGRSVVTAVGGRDLIVRKILMDRMPLGDAREVIRLEAEQYVPFEMSNVQLDFQILDPEAPDLQMNVLLVAAKRELVDQRMMLLSNAGLSHVVVDVDAFAIFNAFEYNYPAASRGASAVANIGHEIATVIIYQDGVPLVTRDIPYGSKHLREELRRMHGRSADEADGLVQGIIARDPDIDRLFYERAAELGLAIERATAILGDDSGSPHLTAVYLTGGGARIPRLQDAISDRLRVRIETANPLQRLDIAAEAMAEVPSEEAASMWMLPVGLALRAPA